MTVSVMATCGRGVRAAGRVLSRMPATVLLAAVGLAWALSAIITGVSSPGPDTAAASPSASPVPAGSVRLVGYSSGGGQCGDPGCGGGAPKWNDPAQGPGSVSVGGSAAGARSSGGALDWASNLLGLDSGPQMSGGRDDDKTAKPPLPEIPEQSGGKSNAPELGHGGLLAWANQLASDLTKTIGDALGKLGIGGSGGTSDQAGKPPPQAAPGQEKSGKPDDRAGKPDQPAAKPDRAGKPDRSAAKPDRAGKPDQATGRPDQDKTAKPPLPGNPEQQSGGKPTTGSRPERGGLATWATDLASDLTETIGDALGKLGTGGSGGTSDQPGRPRPLAAPGQDHAGGPNQLDRAGKPDQSVAKPDSRTGRRLEAAGRAELGGKLTQAGRSAGLGDRSRAVAARAASAEAVPDSGGGFLHRGEHPDQAVLSGGGGAGGSGAGQGGQRTRPGGQSAARFAANVGNRVNRVLGKIADFAGEHAAQGHQQRMQWLAAAHGPHDPHPSGRTPRASTSDDPDPDSEASAPTSGGGVFSPVAQATPTAGTLDSGRPTGGSQARLTGNGMAVPTSDGGQLTITPTTAGPNSSVTPDLANGRYLITAKNAQAPSSYDFHLDMPKGSRAVTNDSGGVDIVNGAGNITQTIAAPWAKDANGRALPTRFEVNGNTLTQHVAFDENTAFPVLADPATGESADKPAAKPADKPAAKPADKPAAKPADKPAAKPADKPAAKPADKPVVRPVSATAAGSGDDRPTVVVDAKGKNFECKDCSGSTVDIGKGTPGPNTGKSTTYTGKDQHIVVVNAGPKTTVSGDHTTVTGGDGNHRQVTSYGNGSTVKLGNGDHNQAVTAGNGNKAQVGNGSHNEAIAGKGSHNSATVGDGDHNRAVTGAGNHNTAHVGNGGHNEAIAGKGSHNSAAVGDGDHNNVVTGAGNDNSASAGNGSYNRVTAGKGSGNAALAGNGDHNRVTTGAGNDNLAVAGNGSHNRVTAGGPGNRNMALAGDGDHNRVVVGEGNNNLAGVGAGRGNLTRTGPGNNNQTFTGPGPGSRTQVGSGHGNTANQHPVAPGHTGPFTPGEVPQPPAQQPQHPGQQPNNPAQQTGQQQQRHVDPLISPYVKSAESGVQNFVGKYNRYQRTLRDAATRHLIASDQYSKLGSSLRSSKVPGTNIAAGLADRYSNWRAGRAQRYGAMSERLGEITKKTLRQGGVHGHLPVPLQRGASYTLADRFNRLPAVNGKAGENPKIVNNPAVRGALKSDPKFPVTNNIKRIGGLNLTETARRGLTKVSGPVSLAFGAADVANQIAHGVKPGEAIGKTASGIAVSGAASALTTAAIAAAVPGAGWAVAGGIVVGLGASYAWDALGGSKLAAKAGGWVQDRVTDGAKAVADGAKKAGNAVKHFFGF